jgi:hypothetical protein
MPSRPGPPTTNTRRSRHRTLGTHTHAHTHTHTHTHPGALVPRFSSIYTQHTLAAGWPCSVLRNKEQEARRGPSTTPQQDAAPRAPRPSASTTPQPQQARSKKQDAAPRQRHRLPKTFPLVTRQETRSTRPARRDRFRRPSISLPHVASTTTRGSQPGSSLLSHRYSLIPHCIRHRPGAFWLGS